MRRTVYFASLWLVLASVPLLAQHGGHGSFGGHSGFGGHGGMTAHVGSAAHMGAGHASAGMRPGSGFGLRASGRGPSFHNSFGRRDFDRFHDRRFHRRFRNDCFAFGCGWGWGGEIDPYWWWDSDSYDQDQQNQIQMANEMNAQSLEEQRMRQQANDQDVYARSDPPPAPDPPPTHARQPDTQVVPTTVLIFRDQHKEEVQNYAIVGQTLWNFAPQHKQKIPLSDLDLAATIKANDDRGVEFHVPGANEGQ